MIVVTNPENLELLESINKEGSHTEYGIPSMNCIRIRVDSSIPARDIEEEWSRPKSGRFCEYGPEDEKWMRPLRIGVFTQIDKGPLFYFINDLSVRTDFMSNVMNMNALICNTY